MNTLSERGGKKLKDDFEKRYQYTFIGIKGGNKRLKYVWI